ncbi:MAG: hypothetical protein LBF37_00030 [Rickettsiales bacterium]|nr:hypothetical protein [Rickettsiales bacterium]
MPNLIGVIQAIHIAKQIPAAPLIVASRDKQAFQTTVLIAYALGIKIPFIHQNPNFEVFWHDSLRTTFFEEHDFDYRCLAVSVSNRPVINEVAMGMGNRHGDMVAFKADNWDDIFSGECAKEEATQVKYQYMQQYFTGRQVSGLENELKKALYFKTMYKFIQYAKTKSEIMNHQIYSDLYEYR